MFFKKRVPGGQRLDRVAQLYLAHKFFGALYFTYPIFYEFATQALTPVQVGLFFSAVGVCGFIAEIPTGIIADKRSRKFSGFFGMLLLAIAPLVIYFGHTFPAYLAAALFYGLGGAFLNGALDSLVYDHKNVTKQAYRKINALEISYGQAGILVSAAAGGVLFSVGQGLPFIIQAASGIVCLVLVGCMQEHYKKGHVKPASSHGRHFIESMKHLFATPYLRVLVLMGVTFSVMLGMCIQFVHEAAMIEHGLTATLRGFLVSGAGVVTLIILNLVLLRILRGDIARLIYMGGGAAVAYTFMCIGIMPLFMLGYLFWCCLNATSSFIRVMLQDSIPGSHRSTIMSSFKTLAISVGLGASTGTGLLVEWAHTPRAAYLLFALISVGILLPCTVWLVRHIRRPRFLPQYATIQPMDTYLILLRGINVGGKNKISMAELKTCLGELGFENVTTYINSGNVLLDSKLSPAQITDKIEALLPTKFKLDSSLIKILTLSHADLRAVVGKAPKGFGTEPDKYYCDAIFLMGATTVKEALPVFTPREGVDRIWPGDGVIYSERLGAMRVKSRLGKIIGTPVYKSMTIRSWGTTQKLLHLLDERKSTKN